MTGGFHSRTIRWLGTFFIETRAHPPQLLISEVLPSRDIKSPNTVSCRFLLQEKKGRGEMAVPGHWSSSNRAEMTGMAQSVNTRWHQCLLLCLRFPGKRVTSWISPRTIDSHGGGAVAEDQERMLGLLLCIQIPNQFFGFHLPLAFHTIWWSHSLTFLRLHRAHHLSILSQAFCPFLGSQIIPLCCQALLHLPCVTYSGLLSYSLVGCKFF